MAVSQSSRRVDGGRIRGPQNVPNVLEIRFVVQLPNGRNSVGVLHGAFTSAPTNLQTLANTLFTSLSSAWATNLGALMSTTTRFTSVAVRDMTSALNPIFIGTGTAAVGTDPANAMPPRLAAVLTENVAIRGRGMNGRIFLGGWTVTADAGAGLMSGAAQTALNAFGTAVFSAISAQTLIPCVAQVPRQAYLGLTGLAHPARAASHVNVNSYTSRDLIWDGQRRRSA